MQALYGGCVLSLNALGFRSAGHMEGIWCYNVDSSETDRLLCGKVAFENRAHAHPEVGTAFTADAAYHFRLLRFPR
jgi:hypothetical protein